MKITKKCSGCGQVKSVDEFGSDTSRIDGKNGKCKACITERNKARKPITAIEVITVPTQSEVVANDLDVVTVDQWALALFVNESERRVRDIDLAIRLEFAQPRMIRKLIKRHAVDLAKLGELVAVETVERTTIPGKNEVSRTVTEYWLNRDQAMYLAAKSETAKANEVTVQLVLTFRELEKRALADLSKLTRQEKIFNEMLLTAKRTWIARYTYMVNLALNVH